MYNKILLKLSGEVLSGKKGFGISPKTLNRIISEIIEIKKQGKEIAIVIGGGNIFRGSKLIKDMNFPDYKAHHMGMIGTIINGLALETVFRQKGVDAINYTAFNVEGITNKYNVDEVRKQLKDKIVILTGGTGNPFFSTDSAAALRASELSIEAIFKATKVDGVYDKDPEKYEDAQYFSEISYKEYINQNLQVMDINSVLICRDNNIPIYIFNILKENNFNLVLNQKSTYTVIK